MNSDHSPSLPFEDRTAANVADGGRQWQAFRYVLGEMSPDESQAYEQLLAADQEARELVAASVGLVADLYRAEPIAIARPAQELESSATHQTRQRNRSWIAVVCSLACLIAAAGLWFSRPREERPLDEQAVSDAAESGPGSLVAIWAERQEEAAGIADPLPGMDEAVAELPSADQTGTDHTGDNHPAADQSGSEEYNVPGWLLAAVSVDDKGTQEN